MCLHVSYTAPTRMVATFFIYMFKVCILNPDFLKKVSVTLITSIKKDPALHPRNRKKCNFTCTVLHI